MSQGDQPVDPEPGHTGYPQQEQPPYAAAPGYGPPPGHAGYGPPPGQGTTTTDQLMSSATEAASRAAQTVRRMPWQERVLRLPGALAVISGVFVLLSCLFPWWSLFDRTGGPLVEYSIAPFRGVSASSGSRWSDMAAMNLMSADDLETAQTITTSVGLALVVAALTMIGGGILVALGRAQIVGIALTLFGAVVLGYARVPSEIVGGISDAAATINTSLGQEFALLADMVGSMIPEARLGLGLSTFALTLVTLGLVIYVGMLIYRETLRIRKWMA